VNKSTTAETSEGPSTDCQHEPFLFPDLAARKVVADFTGGTLSSDGGAPLLRRVASASVREAKNLGGPR
jgi:hypothetical protein